MVSDREQSLRFWTRVRRGVRVLLALTVGLGVFLLSRGAGPEEVAVLPDTTSQFSLDLRVIDSADVDIVYLVEQRARPAYRIFAFDPRTGAETTVFTVPEDAIIYGIALSPDRSTLAVGYSPDFGIEGSGVWTLDLDSLEFSMVVDAEPGIYLTELEFAADGQSVYATHVDRRGEDEALALARVDLDERSSRVVLENAITPAVVDDDLYYLIVDDQKARRSIGVLTSDGEQATVSISDGELDLDHLVARSETGGINVAVLEATAEPLITVGATADAHGNHNVRSSWWIVNAADAVSTPTSVDPIIVYDAAKTADGTLVYATLEGLAVATGSRQDLIASRAIRFVAA